MTILRKWLGTSGDLQSPAVPTRGTLALAGHVTNLGGTVDLNGPGASFPALNALVKIAAGAKLNITNGGSLADARSAITPREPCVKS